MKRKETQSIKTYMYLRTLNMPSTEYQKSLKNLQKTWDSITKKQKS